jgi:cell wall-associated NlpC family hydrolase
LTALITAGSPESFLDRLTLLDTVARNQQRSIATLNSAAAALNAQKQQLDLLLAKQKQQKASLDAQKSKITAEITALRKQRDQLAAQTGSSATTTGSTTGTAPAVSGKAGIAVKYAYAQLGKPYVFGAAGPNSFDCSGLTMAAWAAAGVQLDHYTGSQLQQTTPISRSQLQPGDLVFFYGGSHVGIYVGNNSIIHAPQPGEVVKISSIDWMGGYYASRRVS